MNISKFSKNYFIISIAAISDWEILFCKEEANAPKAETIISSLIYFQKKLNLDILQLLLVIVKSTFNIFLTLENICLIIWNDNIGINGSGIL